VDALSEILKAIKLRGSLFFNAELTSPWCLREPSADEIAPFISPDGGNLVLFHMVTEGKLYARLDAGERRDLTAGEVVVFPHGDHHILGSGKPERPVNSMTAFAGNLTRGLKLAHYGGGGEVSRLVCGYIVCEKKLSDRFLWGLPKMFTVRPFDGPGGAWLESAIRYSVDGGNSEAGSELVISRLAEVLFVEVVRRYLNSLPAEQKGWLAGVRDPAIGVSIALMHMEPAEDWTIDRLAKKVCLSRTSFVQRFQEFLGESPMAYLAKWRLQLGSELLLSADQSVAEIALSVGYSSEASFNRAFKREFGIPPAKFRRTQRHSNGL